MGGRHVVVHGAVLVVDDLQAALRPLLGALKLRVVDEPPRSSGPEVVPSCLCRGVALRHHVGELRVGVAPTERGVRELHGLSEAQGLHTSPA
eukprot:13973314-Alexandrium_andersonii.AAC.1